MDRDFIYSKHYVRLDANNNIIYGYSNSIEQSQKSDICINEQGGRQFELLGQINPPLQDMQGIYFYKYKDGEIIAKTPVEIHTEIDALPKPVPVKSIDEKIQENQALIYYIGMMAGVM